MADKANHVDVTQRRRTVSLWGPSRRWLVAYLLMLPAVLITALMILYPIVSAVDISFQEVRIAHAGRARGPWVLDNYVRLVGSTEFWQATWVTLKLVTFVTTLCFVIGLGIAVLVNQRFRGRTLARLLVALPWAIPSVVAAVIWWWILDSSFGLLNWLLIRVGFLSGPINWLSSPQSAFFAVSLVMLWKGYPFVSIMLLAGLQAIPDELYEAAEIDGAGKWQRFRYITIPGLRPVLAVALILIILWIFRDFPIIWILTGGGPLRATQTLAILTYREGFGFFNMGYAAAIGVITLIICIAASALMIRRLSTDFY